jgi:hypothetical protein
VKDALVTGFDITHISKPIFVMAFVAAMILAAALLLSTMISSAERPIETGASGISLVWPTPIETV